ncbi:MAG: exosome complex RNA-binding protein Rrp4 [Candidatus Thorarchaeota archaeon]
MEILVSRNQLVIPGEVLARGRGDVKAGGGVYRRKRNDMIEVCASMVGLAQIRRNRVEIVPQRGGYIPLEGDIVIGKIIRVGITSWNVDIRGPYVGTLRVGNVIERDFDSLRESLDRILQVGDIIKAEIMYFDRTRDPMLTMLGRGLRKITSGKMIEVSPVKVPRIIGKKGSMIQLLKNMTGGKLLVGQNGRIIISANDTGTELILERAVKKIAAEAHTTGLTDRIHDFLETEMSRDMERSDTNE